MCVKIDLMLFCHPLMLFIYLGFDSDQCSKACHIGHSAPVMGDGSGGKWWQALPLPPLKAPLQTVPGIAATLI